ncbi:hypothetical protein AAF463_24370 (plasmid) [Pantoea sp. BJ2]|uniref:Uncharacterized protein n=1 Tax=Pantoea sp. BJ2 TaxID=3141322 RepID=A0AAU7U3P5_9GAMM
MFEKPVMLSQYRDGMNSYLAYSKEEKIIKVTSTPYVWILGCDKKASFIDDDTLFFDFKLKKSAGRGYLCPYEIDVPGNQPLSTEIRINGTMLFAELLDVEKKSFKIYEPVGLRVLTVDKNSRIIFSPDSKSSEMYSSWIINYPSLFK